MRFAIKTRPEHQTWAQSREIWLAADKIEPIAIGGRGKKRTLRAPA